MVSYDSATSFAEILVPDGISPAKTHRLLCVIAALLYRHQHALWFVCYRVSAPYFALDATA